MSYCNHAARQIVASASSLRHFLASGLLGIDKMTNNILQLLNRLPDVRAEEAALVESANVLIQLISGDTTDGSESYSQLDQLCEIFAQIFDLSSQELEYDYIDT